MNDKPPIAELVLAKKNDLDTVLKLVREYHELEGIELSNSKLMNAVYPLLKKQNEHGCILFIQSESKVVGYLVLCFSYSIELGGKNASIDQFFLKREYQGKKLGKAALNACKVTAKELGLNSLTIKLHSEADRLMKIFEDSGFSTHNKYQLLSCKTTK